MKKIAVIVAGGNGSRMGSSMPKQFMALQGKPLLWHSIMAFVKAYPDIEIILVLPEKYLQYGKEITTEFPGVPVQVTAGGNTRFDSVKKGLSLITAEAVVFVHDAVRCLVSEQLIKKCYEQAVEKGSAIPAIAATDSMRVIHAGKHAVVSRDDVRIIQTPQTFLSDILLPAFQQTFNECFTDEATVVESTGREVFLVEGEYSNIKITRPVDLIIAEQILQP